MEHFLGNYYVLQTMEDLFLLPHFFPCTSMRQMLPIPRKGWRNKGLDVKYLIKCQTLSVLALGFKVLCSSLLFLTLHQKQLWNYDSHCQSPDKLRKFWGVCMNNLRVRLWWRTIEEQNLAQKSAFMKIFLC